MFNFRLRVKLCVLVFGILVSTIQSRYVDPLPIYDDCTCVDTPYFLAWLEKGHTDVTIFQKIAEPLMVFPEEIKLYAENIHFAIYSEQIKISNIVRYLKEYTNLNRFDLMISFFLHLAVGACGNVPNEIKAEALKIVSYALEKKYLHLLSTPILELNTIPVSQPNFVNNYNEFEGHGSNIKEIIFGSNKNNILSNWDIPTTSLSTTNRENSYSYNQNQMAKLDNYQYPNQYSSNVADSYLNSATKVNKFDYLTSHSDVKKQTDVHSKCCNCQNSLIQYLVSQLISKNQKEQEYQTSFSTGVSSNSASGLGSDISYGSLSGLTSDYSSGLNSDLSAYYASSSGAQNYVRGDSFASAYNSQIDSLTESLISQIIVSLPQPKDAVEQEYFSLIQSFLQSSTWRTYLKTLNVSTLNVETLWNYLRQYILTSAEDVKLKTAFEYYTSYKQTNFSFASLISLLPTPTNDKEIQWYNAAKSFLSSSEAYTYFQGMNFANQNINDVYVTVLQTLSNLGLGEYWQHYLNVHLGIANGFDCGKILAALPQPKTDAEFTYYSMLSNYLSTSECSQHFVDVNWSTMTAEQMLIHILRTLYQRNILVEASEYYLGLLTSSQYGFNVHDVMSTFSQLSSEEQNMRHTIESYMFSDEFHQMASTLKSSESYTNNNELLQQILHLIAEKSAQQEIRTVANSLYSRLNENIVTNKLITLLPQPTTDEEKTNFKVVKEFLQSSESAKYIKGIDMSLFNDEKFLLDYVLRKIAESQAELNVLNAFKYYLQFSEKLAALDLITKKEIKRHFKLTEIFTDTLMLDSLTVEQKEAFKSFFKYISEIQPDSLNNFDSWDQAKTRGEFMKLLFSHLQQSPTVPEGIKGCINTLGPLIQTTGRAALPPHSG